MMSHIMMSHMAHKTDHTTLERFAAGRVDTSTWGGLAPAPFRATRFNSDMRMHEYVADEKTRRPDRRAVLWCGTRYELRDRNVALEPLGKRFRLPKSASCG